MAAGEELTAGASSDPALEPAGPGVVKLGGSVVFSPRLASWLDVLAAASSPVVIVPGGGPFADQVRSTQERLGFGEAAAHRMALLAMEQSALALADGSDRFEVAHSPDEIEQALDRNRIPVWAPSAMCLDQDDIPASWSVTSDSLALWLGRVLGAKAVYLVKSMRVAAPDCTASRLAERGVVDAALPEFLPRARGKAYLLGPGDQAALAKALARGGPAGRPISLA